MVYCTATRRYVVIIVEKQLCEFPDEINTCVIMLPNDMLQNVPSVTLFNKLVIANLKENSKVHFLLLVYAN